MNLDLIQAAAVDKLSKLKAGALFMHMGTGKTKTAIDLAKSRRHDFDCIVWIAPASLIYDPTYRTEIERWSFGLEKLIHYYTIEGVSQSDTKFLEMRSLAENKRTFCIVDESLTIKNADAGRTERLCQMWDKFTFRLILNGTPLSKGLIDLYSQINFIHPRILNMTETQFAHNFLQFRKEGYRPWQRWSRPENEEALIEKIRPYIFDAQLDIPVEINFYNKKFKLSRAERENYQDFKREFLRDDLSVDFMAATQAFQQFYTVSKSKILGLESIVSKILSLGEKVIVFVKFHKELEELMPLFDCLEYSGRKKDSIQEFKDKKHVLFCTYGTGSKGLNLQFCNNIIFFSQTFDYAHKEHAIHRVYRNGQTKDVNVWNLWLNVGLESLFSANLDKKLSTASHINKIISKEEAMKL